MWIAATKRLLPLLALTVLIIGGSGSEAQARFHVRTFASCADNTRGPKLCAGNPNHAAANICTGHYSHPSPPLSPAPNVCRARRATSTG